VVTAMSSRSAMVTPASPTTEVKAPRPTIFAPSASAMRPHFTMVSMFRFASP